MAERVLVFLPRWVGDALLATPALQLLRRRPGVAAVSVLASPANASVFQGLPFVDSVIVRSGFFSTASRLRSGRFDVVYVLPNSFSSALLAAASGIPRRVGYAREGRSLLLTQAKPWPGETVHRAARYASLMGLPLEGFSPAACPCAIAGGAEAEREADRLLAGLEASRLVGVNPCSTNAPSRRWDVARFAALARALAAAGFTPVLLGGPAPADRARADAVKAAAGAAVADLCGRTSLPGLAAVLRRMRLLVTGDVGLMHVGAAAGVPILVLAGASDTAVTGPWTSAPVRVLRKPVACAPCVRNRCVNRETPMICMDSITAEEVVEAARELLSCRA